MSLVQSQLERRGIVTASLSMLPAITARLAPPRALVVDAPLGAPVGPPHDAERQLATLRRLLTLLPRQDLPVLERGDD
ncbi:MAG: hypothetical protein AB7U83_12135 [Vicinamibacterales bacterium]